MQPPAEERLRPPEAGRHKEDPRLVPSEGMRPRGPLGFGRLAPWLCERNRCLTTRFVVLSVGATGNRVEARKSAVCLLHN